MIVANMASYPARAPQLRQSLPVIAAQADRVHLVLNEYDGVPDWIAALANVVCHLPDEDLKDVGKFAVCDADADLIFLVDDDLNYPVDYIARSLERLDRFGTTGIIAGYHASRYLPVNDPTAPRPYKRVVRHFQNPQAEYLFADQIATNSAILRPSEMPPLDYMLGSQCFVDVRLAKWSFERDIPHVVLPRERFWITQIKVQQSIFKSFTDTFPAHVDDEILTFALKRADIAVPFPPARSANSG